MIAYRGKSNRGEERGKNGEQNNNVEDSENINTQNGGHLYGIERSRKERRRITRIRQKDEKDWLKIAR